MRGSLSADGKALDVARLNGRSTELQRYHAHTSAMELAYRCRDAPAIFTGQVDLDDEGRCLRVYTHKGRVRVPLHDTFFAEPIAASFDDGGQQVRIELCGILKAGRTQLRVRMPRDELLPVRGAGFEGGAREAAVRSPARSPALACQPAAPPRTSARMAS